MRELKFRAWNKKAKHMIQTALSITDSVYFGYAGSELKMSDLVWMQFTGLHDKNGKEIWEGDVVNITQTIATYPSSGSVVWNKVVAGYEVRVINPYYKNKFVTVKLARASIEVIGNIYESPQLLEKSK